MLRAIVVAVAALAVPTSVAWAEARPASWSELVANAEPAGDLKQLFAPLFAVARCPTTDDLAARECRSIEEFHRDRLRERRFLVTGQDDALTAQPYDPSEKTLTLDVTGCVACTWPPVLDGTARPVVSGAPTRVEGTTLRGLDLGFHDVPLADAETAKKWVAKTLPRLKVEYVIAQPTPLDAGDFHGVKVTILGHAVYDKCTGQVIVSDPPGAPPHTPDPTCPKDEPSPEELAEQQYVATLPAQLSSAQIEGGMVPVKPYVAECASTFELKGTALVHLVLHGSGAPPDIKFEPPYDAGEGNLCLKGALKHARFSRFRNTEMKVDYPFPLNP